MEFLIRNSNKNQTKILLSLTKSLYGGELSKLCDPKVISKSEFSLGTITTYPRISPISHLFGTFWDKRTPRLSADGSIRFPNDFKLTIRLNFADNHRFMQMVVFGIHHHLAAR